VDWNFAQKIYGWSAFQYQAWLKGVIVNHGPISQTVTLFPNNIIEIWVGDVHVFGGDFFGFSRAPVVVDLHPGSTVVSVRLVREVRSMGGIHPPTVQATLRAQAVTSTLDVPADGMLLPDVVDGRLCSGYGSVTVSNQADVWLTVRQLTAVSNKQIVGVMYQEITLAPGQSRPLKMIFDVAQKLDKFLSFDMKYSQHGSGVHELRFTVWVQHTNASSLQKITFLHPSGAVSYATLTPPSVSPASGHEAAVLLNLHGAGVEAGGSLARHMFDGAPDLPAWILTPTGMSPWSGDDWHTWGFADAQAAVSAIPDWIETNGWKGPGVHTKRLLVVGHSNGGQGAWFYASHQPDRVLGVAAASGYTSIENYVPYVMWNEADPLQTAHLHSSRASFRHELLVENLVGIPVLQQHGSADDNVPAYHSRLMNTLLAQTGQLAQYSEILGEGHWFDGTMTTEPMINFYQQHLSNPLCNITAPSSSTFVIANSHDMGSKYGIVVDQLSAPERLGKVAVSVNVNSSRRHWHLRTENIHRFHLDSSVHLTNAPNKILVDDMPHPFQIGTENTSFVRDEAGIWGLEVALNWKTLDTRYGRQRGPLDAILRSVGPFEVVFHSNDTLAMAVQTSRNFLQYFGADTNIVASQEYEEALKRQGNVVTICSGVSVPEARLAHFPIQITHGYITLTTRDRGVMSIPLTAGMGGVWLRPLPDEKLELVVWGYDDIGLRQAVRLIPTVTGAGVPDFVILSNQARWKGAGGSLAMGFFDHGWKISPASYLP
jgi:predicted esterase